MAYGVTTTGFIKKDLDTLLEDNRNRAISEFGSDIDLSDEAPLGLIINLLSFQQSQLWDLAESVYNSQYQRSAEGIPLDNSMATTNNTRLDPIKSTVVATIIGTNGTLIESGFRASVAGDSSSVFETTSNFTIPVSGTIDVTMIATEFGAIIANAGTLTTIDTPVFGVTSITNNNDATIGRAEESDADFKLRGRNEKQKSGTSPVEGIRKAIRDLDNIVQAIVIENDTDVTDGDGRPPHSIEAVVQGGDDTEIAQAIFNSKAGGIQTFGSTSIVITDSQGISKTINFNRPVTKDIYVIVNVTKNTDTSEGALYPVDGDQQIKDAIVSWGADFLIARDVLRDGANGIINPINTVAGIRAVDVLFGLTPTPTTSTPISIGLNELATFISGNITVNS